MAKRTTGQSASPRNVERANRDEEREARVAEMVTRLRKDGTGGTTKRPAAADTKPSRAGRKK